MTIAPHYTGTDLLGQPRKPWLIRGLLREGSLTVVSGRPGSYKSFGLLDLAYSIAAGRDWFGQRTRQKSVLYVAAERGSFMRERIEALKARKGIETGTVDFFVQPFPLDDPDEKQRLCDSIEEAGLRPGVVIFDTLRASFGGDENNNLDANRLVTAVNEIREEYDSTVILVHHVDKVRQQLRGSGVFLGAIDHELFFTSRKRDGVRVQARKTNHGEQWFTLRLRPEVVDLGHDPNDDEDYSSVVLHLVEQVEGSAFAGDDEDEVDPRLVIIPTVLSDEPMGLNAVQRALAEIEGAQRNKETLKKQLQDLSGTTVDIIDEGGRLSYRRLAAA